MMRIVLPRAWAAFAVMSADLAKADAQANRSDNLA